MSEVIKGFGTAVLVRWWQKVIRVQLPFRGTASQDGVTQILCGIMYKAVRSTKATMCIVSKGLVLFEGPISAVSGMWLSLIHQPVINEELLITRTEEGHELYLSLMCKESPKAPKAVHIKL